MKKQTDIIHDAQIYREEYAFLKHARQALDDPDLSQDALRASYRSVVAEYDILLRKIVKMTGISDRALRKLRDANARIKAQQKAFTDSIRYAEKIQHALLPDPGEVRAYLPDSFFLWMPRDIVGGDIYFAARFESGIIVAVVDCTGHGVPGAFMSMIASSFVRRITTILNCHNPSEILGRLGRIVRTSLQQDREDTPSDDGLDAAICFIETGGREQDAGECSDRPWSSARRVTFAGARLPLFYVRNREVRVISGDKQSLGYKRSDPDFRFTNHTIPVEPGMRFYMSTDGFWEQLGENEGRRVRICPFGKRRFANLLSDISNLPFDLQQEMFVEAFQAHRGEMQIQDDVTVAGFGF